MDTGFKYSGGVWWIVKDPEAELAYGRNWAAWLRDGDVVDDASWTVTPAPAGGVVVDPDRTGLLGQLAVVFLKGGAAGVNYTVSCSVTTAAGDKERRSFEVRCRKR